MGSSSEDEPIVKRSSRKRGRLCSSSNDSDSDQLVVKRSAKKRTAPIINDSDVEVIEVDDVLPLVSAKAGRNLATAMRGAVNASQQKFHASPSAAHSHQEAEFDDMVSPMKISSGGGSSSSSAKRGSALDSTSKHRPRAASSTQKKVSGNRFVKDSARSGDEEGDSGGDLEDFVVHEKRPARRGARTEAAAATAAGDDSGSDDKVEYQQQTDGPSSSKQQQPPSDEEEAEFDDEKEAELADVGAPQLTKQQLRTPGAAARSRAGGSRSSGGTGTTQSLTASGRPLRSAAASVTQRGGYRNLLGSTGEDSDNDNDYTADASDIELNDTTQRSTHASATAAGASASRGATQPATAGDEDHDSELDALSSNPFPRRGQRPAASTAAAGGAAAAATAAKPKGKGKGKAKDRQKVQGKSSDESINLANSGDDETYQPVAGDNNSSGSSDDEFAPLAKKLGKQQQTKKHKTQKKAAAADDFIANEDNNDDQERGYKRRKPVKNAAAAARKAAAPRKPPAKKARKPPPAAAARRSREPVGSGSYGVNRYGESLAQKHDAPEDFSSEQSAADTADFIASEGEEESEESGSDDGVDRSAASLFAQQQIEEGMNSVGHFGVQSMDLQEAFKVYIQYIAKCVQDGSGSAFMKRWAASMESQEFMQYTVAKNQVEKKICTSRDTAYSSMAWRPEVYTELKRRPFLRYTESYAISTTCEVCNRQGHPASSVTELIGPEYEANMVWDSRRWDKKLPEGWRDADARKNFTAQAGTSQYFMGSTCQEKTRGFHTCYHYKLYICMRVLELLRSNTGVTADNICNQDDWWLKEWSRYKLLYKAADGMQQNSHVDDSVPNYPEKFLGGIGETAIADYSSAGSSSDASYNGNDDSDEEEAEFQDSQSTRR